MSGVEDLEKELLDMKKRIRDLESNTLIKYLIMPATGVFRPPIVAGDPASPTEGDVWYDITNHRWRGRKNGSTVTFTTA